MTAAPTRVCLFGTFDSERHPRVRVLEEGLAAAGYDVVRCNEPWSATTAERVGSLRSPFLALRLAFRLVRSWWRLRRSRCGLGKIDVVVTGYLGVLDIHLARRWCPGAILVLDHLAPVAGTLADRGLGTSVRQRAAIGIDAAARRAADVVLVDTDQHQIDDRDVVVRVGASEVWFDARVPERRAADRSRCRIVFFGLFTPLQGVPTIARAVVSLHEAGVPFELTMIGDGQEMPAVRDLLTEIPHVLWRDWVAPPDLPALVANHDVCLGIFGTSPKARRVVPNKVFQGAAAGCAIVTSRTEPQTQLLGTHALYAEPGDPSSLAEQLGRLAMNGGLCNSLQEEAACLADDLFRPAEVVRPLDRLLRAGL